jgi:hypothetical protein
MRAAVFLRGHRRTWDWCNAALSHTLQQLFSTVHCYACIWQTQTCTVPLSAHGMEFKHSELTIAKHWDSTAAINSFTAPSWQAQRCWQAMAATGISYDLVIDTRPDIWLAANDTLLQLPLRSELYSTLLQDPWHGSTLPGMEDHLYIAEPHTMGLWCQRHAAHRLDISYNHCILWNYCREHGFKPRQITGLSTAFARPNIVDYAPTVADLLRCQHAWAQMSPTHRLAHCVTAGIDRAEYAEPYHVGSV